MNSRYPLLRASIAVAVVVLSPPAWAQQVSVRDLAEETGLSQRQVQMLLGARTAFPEYKTGYRFVERQFKDALGEQRYRDLMAGRPIPLRGRAAPTDPARLHPAPDEDTARRAAPDKAPSLASR